MRVLCLDTEGGHGGSSRSLYHLLASMDRAGRGITAEVWCRRRSWVEEAYAEIGVGCRVMPTMPKVSTLPRLSRNLIVRARFLADWRRSGAFRQALVEAASDVDLVHANHESLADLMAWLRPRLPQRVALTQHVRTMCWTGHPWFARAQAKRIATAADAVAFITGNERQAFTALAPPRHDAVIHNIAQAPAAGTPVHPGIPRDDRLKVAVLSNYSWMRGIDRLLDVAALLRQRDRQDVHFVIAGDMRLEGPLAKDHPPGACLADVARTRGLGDVFTFLGHVAAPEQVLVGCDLLAKPTREANPWGRDVLEALAAGRPVVSVGRDTTFVESGVTGLLQPEFDAAGMAEALAAWATDRSALERLKHGAAERAERLCGPPMAAALADLWHSAVEARR